VKNCSAYRTHTVAANGVYNKSIVCVDIMQYVTYSFPASGVRLSGIYCTHAQYTHIHVHKYNTRSCCILDKRVTTYIGINAYADNLCKRSQLLCYQWSISNGANRKTVILAHGKIQFIICKSRVAESWRAWAIYGKWCRLTAAVNLQCGVAKTEPN
jgi:hypothetical protein